MLLCSPPDPFIFTKCCYSSQQSNHVLQEGPEESRHPRPDDGPQDTTGTHVTASKSFVSSHVRKLVEHSSVSLHYGTWRSPDFGHGHLLNDSAHINVF